MWGGEGPGLVRPWLVHARAALVRVPLGLAGGTAPSAVRRGQTWAPGWQQAWLPAHPGLTATPQDSLAWGQAGRGSLGLTRAFAPSPGKVG